MKVDSRLPKPLAKGRSIILGLMLIALISACSNDLRLPQGISIASPVGNYQSPVDSSTKQQDELESDTESQPAPEDDSSPQTIAPPPAASEDPQ
ncbi:hypothetical protein [Motiliproteus sp.]|uniref:hypothetical protein n=1 Tax=Motiliproteus sp. TaxID=1898955 RepID=UPI003BAA8E42